MDQPCKWRHYHAEIILVCVRWYLRYPFSYRDLEEMMHERGRGVDHTTIYRWVQHYAPELEQRIKLPLTPTHDSWRVDETYVKMRKRWMDLYRAVDSDGYTVACMLSDNRNARAANRFFCTTRNAQPTVPPRAITVDKHAAYPTALCQLNRTKRVSKQCLVRQWKDVNTSVAQDHRFIKRLVQPGFGCASCETAARTLGGYEVMHMLRTGQIHGTHKGNIRSQGSFTKIAVGIAACIPVIRSLTTARCLSPKSLQHNRKKKAEPTLFWLFCGLDKRTNHTMLGSSHGVHLMTQRIGQRVRQGHTVQPTRPVMDECQSYLRVR